MLWLMTNVSKMKGLWNERMSDENTIFITIKYITVFTNTFKKYGYLIY